MAGSGNSNSGANDCHHHHNSSNCTLSISYTSATKLTHSFASVVLFHLIFITNSVWSKANNCIHQDDERTQVPSDHY